MLVFRLAYSRMDIFHSRKKFRKQTIIFARNSFQRGRHATWHEIRNAHLFENLVFAHAIYFRSRKYVVNQKGAHSDVSKFTHRN